MKFVSFLIVCAVALVAYYLYLILAPEKKSQMFDDGRREGSMETIIEIEPIEVSADMVTYQPQAAVESPERHQTEEQTEKQDDNKYSAPSLQSMSMCQGERILVPSDQDVIEGRLIVSLINI